MTEIHDPLVPRCDELRLLLEDLACVSGTLSEIMTAWRRVQPGRPERRPGRLVRLQDDARQLAADIEAAGSGGLALGLALSAAVRLAALEEDAAEIRAVTTGPGCPEAVDRGLWELLAAALCRAQARLTALTPAAVPGQPDAGRVRSPDRPGKDLPGHGGCVTWQPGILRGSPRNARTARLSTRHVNT